MTFITVKRVFSYLSSFFQELTRQLWTLLSLVRFRYCIQLMFIVFVFFSFTYWIVAAYATNYQHLIRLKMKLMNDDNNNISNREITAIIDITTSNHSTKDDSDVKLSSIDKYDTFISSVLLAPQLTATLSFKSSCSRSADERGPHQKVIGYAIYGDFSQKKNANRYVEPLREIIKAIPTFYPGWIVRIHHNLIKEENETSSWKIFEKAIEAANHVDFCNVTEILEKYKFSGGALFAMTWRWFPLLDALVDTFMSRDADSMILTREQDAVFEWMASNKTFHLMRDHPAHCIFMLGGMWGVKLDKDRSKITKAFESIFKIEHRNQYGYDQQLLTKFIWPIAKVNHMAHDSYCCKQFNESRPFPHQRISLKHFVGRVHQNDPSISIPCPRQCRPLNVDPKWKYC